MSLSTHAAAAKRIRVEMKKHGISGSVRSSTYAGGDSVRVRVNNQPPWVVDAISKFANEHQYGHFNGMEDIYEYSSCRDDIPQVKFVFVENEFSDDMRQRAFEFLCRTMGAYEDMPAGYNEARNMEGATTWVSCEANRVLSGGWDAWTNMEPFWIKPRIAA